MKLERLAMWDEQMLFTEQGEKQKGFVGWLKAYFFEDRPILSEMTDKPDTELEPDVRYELSSLYAFLMSEGAGYMLRTLSDMTAFCHDKLHDHIPYSFNRECFGYRVFTEHYVWYIALTPWNPGRQMTIYCYDKVKLMTALAEERELPVFCHGVLKYTGERIIIRFGEDGYEAFPQYGGNMVQNRKYANEQNEALGLAIEQVSAMENGVVFGWDTPAADPRNYDENGSFVAPEKQTKGKR